MENKNKQMEWETIKMEKMREQPSRPEVIGSFIGMGMGFHKTWPTHFGPPT